MAATVGNAHMPHVPAHVPVPSLDAIRDRVDFDNAMRLWSLGVRFATRELVALGRPFEIHFAVSTPSTGPLQELAPLGFELTALFGSHVMCVKDTSASRIAAAARVVSLQGAPVAAGVTPLDGVRVDDFLVGINGDDLLLAPSTGLAHVRKRILASCNAAGVVTLRFVRLDATVQVDPTRQVTHGSVLRVLATLERHHAELKASYDKLLSRNRAAVTQRLTRHKKLLGFGMHMVQSLQTAVQQDERFQFAVKFQEWYATMMAETEYEDDGDDDDDDAHDDPIEVVDNELDAEMEPTVFEIDDDDDSEEDEEEKEEDNEQDGTEVQAVLPVTVNPSLPPAQPRPVDIDLRWRPILRAQEMKWLSNADAVLTKFIESLVEGFASDGFWIPEIASRSRSIAERLVAMYTAKLRSSSMDNSSVRKEFFQHARMLRSNLANAGNQQLRHDVLSGAIRIEVLCAMTSEQLAPKALQEDRQRRSEQHAKEITLTTPTGPVLVKTKHGYKEVQAVGTLAPVLPETTLSVPDASTVAVSPEQADADSTAMPTGLEDANIDSGLTSLLPTAPGSGFSATVPVLPPKLANPAEEVTQRLSVLGVNTSAVADKKLIDHADVAPPLPRQDSLKPVQPQPEPKPTIAALTLETVKVTTDDFRKFLKVLFDPAQDLEGMIGQLQSVVHSTSLSTMSNEFELAPGVKLYRDILTAKTQRGVHFRARVRLLNWTFQNDSSSDRESTIHALHQLVKEIQECRRLVGRLLDQLRHECGFPQAISNQRAHHFAMDLLVREGVKITEQVFYRRGHDGRTIEGYRGDARIDSIEIATAYADSVIAARDGAVRSAAAFMSDLVAVRNSIVHPPQQDPVPPPPVQPTPRDAGNQHFERERHHKDSRYHGHARYGGNKRHVEVDPFQPSDNNGYERKRPFDLTAPHHAAAGQPAPVRRKLDAPPRSANGSRETPIDPPFFFEDSKGEAPPQAPVDPKEKERQLKRQVEAYQELLRALFRNREDVKARVQFDWNPNVPEQVVEFTKSLKVVCTVSRLPESGKYVCSLQGMEGNLFITNSNASRQAAAVYVTEKMKEWLDGLYADWSQLTDTYLRIMERKFLQRGKQADDSLSAGNETRKDRSVNTFTTDREIDRGASAEYTITVRSLLAVRAVCLNMKMAKRAAAENFRDLVEWIKKTRLEVVKNAAARPSVPVTATKISNMVECSDGSDDDDDDDYHGGGAYSDDEDWHPQGNVISTASDSAKKLHDGSVRSLVAAILREPYPIESERGMGDDARFRAVLRSLFTPADELCTGISQIRGALKFRGHFDTTIVPNVKASIRLDLLRGDAFDVFASVNNVIHCKATASSKPDACDKAVNGLLQELDKIRQVWTELIHFYHTKELSNNDPMDTFNKLRLANITKIDTRTELPPTIHAHNRMLEAKMASDVHCVVYFGDHVVYRVSDAMESDAHTIATARALRFILDLIDKGLDPTPLDEPDHRFAPMPDANIRCMVDLQDVGNLKKRYEFHADARWAIRGRIPPAGFGLPERWTLQQRDRVRMQWFENDFGSPSDPKLYYFRLEATYENGKFVNHVADYGHKNKYRAFVLKFEILESSDFDVYVFPPGASVNSTNNLYWSRKVMPSEIDDVKAVYGYVVRRAPSKANAKE